MMDLETWRRACEAAGEEPPRAYSGRCMYGRQCPALEGGSVPEVLARLVLLVGALEEDGPLVEEVAEAVRSARTDDMGLGVVVYWPDVKWEDER